eukprot:g532.t1
MSSPYGVMACAGQAQNLQREVSFSWATVAEVTAGFLEKTEQVSCKARVEGLLPNTRYNFVLAASNSAGTGRWSPISNCLQTASAPPAAPINTVATVSQDAEQQVVVTISWECPPDLPGSGGLAAFDVQMLPAEMQRVRPSSDRRLVRERLAQRGKPGERIRWAKILAAPGCYVVEAGQRVASESSEGQKSAPAVLTLEVSPEAFPSTELPVAPKWSSEPYLALGPAAESTTRFGSLEGTWLQMLLLWGDPVGPQSTRSEHGSPIGASARASETWPSPVDVLCFFRRPGSSQVFRATLASEVTSSRLQVALPAHVPMSLRLVVKMDPKLAAKTPRPPMSEPLAVLLSDDGETLQPNWEIWARNNPDGQPARWTSIPQEWGMGTQNPRFCWVFEDPNPVMCIEAAWLEGHPKVALQLPHATEGRMAAGSYELTFGDERQTQSTVKKLGPNGWTAKARRSVLTSEEDSTAATASSDEMCVICMERRRTHAFMHADGGHLAVCVDCAEAYRAEAAVPGGSRAVRNCPMSQFGGLAKAVQMDYADERANGASAQGQHKRSAEPRAARPRSLRYDPTPSVARPVPFRPKRRQDHIGERSKGDSQLHSYHQKLRFRSEAKALENDDLVPVAPAIVQVLGPGSVVHMFGLFCDRDGKPLPKVPKSSPSTSATPAPRPAPLTVPTYGSGAVGPSYGYGPQAPQDMLMLTNSWSPPYNQPQSQDRKCRLLDLAEDTARSLPQKLKTS